MNIVLNGRSVEVHTSNLAEVVGSQQATQKGVAVAVNGEVVPRSAQTDHRLHPDDVVDVVSAVPGG